MASTAIDPAALEQMLERGRRGERPVVIVGVERKFGLSASSAASAARQHPLAPIARFAASG